MVRDARSEREREREVREREVSKREREGGRETGPQDWGLYTRTASGSKRLSFLAEAVGNQLRPLCF